MIYERFPELYWIKGLQQTVATLRQGSSVAERKRGWGEVNLRLVSLFRMV